MLRFTKMNGAGNDFVVVDNRAGQYVLSREQIAHLCDRHRGVGGDGLLAVEPARNGADFRMRYYNSDGGEAEMCGNGARCFARYARRLAAEGAERLSFETEAGIISAEFEGELVRLAMSDPVGLRLKETLEIAGRKVGVHSVNTGVPHAVVQVNGLEDVDVHQLGAALRYHEAFAPRGTNVNFVQREAGRNIAIRTYERGVEGETLACGTGVVASALVYDALGGDGVGPVAVKVKGGDTLYVSFEKEEETYRNVTLTGPADFVFEGEVAI